MFGDVLFLWSVVCFYYGLHRNIGRKCVCVYIHICTFKSPAWAFAQAAVFHHKQSYHRRYHGSAMDALEIVCTRTACVIMVRPWMLWKSYAFVQRTSLWFGHGCIDLKKPGLLNGLYPYIYIYIY